MQVFSEEKIRHAIAENRLLVLDLDFAPCGREILTREEIRNVLHQAAELGTEKIILRNGDAISSARLTEMEEDIQALDMTSEIVTGTSCRRQPENDREEDPQSCFRYLYSCVLRNGGNVFPCPGLDLPIGNIREKPLKEILSESLILTHLKEYRRYIKGPCSVCPKADHCCGCRAAAWRRTGDYLASDPTCLRNRDKQSEIRCLPFSSEGAMPHAAPMLFAGQLVKLGERSGVTLSVVQKNNPFLRDDGTLAPEAFIEYGAQTAALMDSFEKDGKVSPGLLIEVKDFHCTGSAVRAGDTIRVDLRKEFEMDIWRGITFTASVKDIPVAEGELKLCIYEPSVS